MPSTSKKQHNFMAAIANNPAFAKKVGVPQSVGKDFNEADKGRKFSKGGDKTAAPSKDGVAVKGKTKGTQIKMAGSGVPNGIGSKVMKKGGMAKAKC